MNYATKQSLHFCNSLILLYFQLYQIVKFLFIWVSENLSIYY